MSHKRVERPISKRKWTLRRIGLPLVLSAAVATGVGCGGSGGSGNPPFTVRADTVVTAGSISKARFLARANLLCRRDWPTILENYAKYTKRHAVRVSGERLFSKSIQSSFLQGLDFYIFDGIHRMPAPRGEAAEVERVIGKLQRAVELGRDRIHVRTQTRFAALFESYNRAAHGYGLDDCLVDGTRLLRVEAF